MQESNVWLEQENAALEERNNALQAQNEVVQARYSQLKSNIAQYRCLRCAYIFCKAMKLQSQCQVLEKDSTSLRNTIAQCNGLRCTQYRQDAQIPLNDTHCLKMVNGIEFPEQKRLPVSGRDVSDNDSDQE